MDYDEKLRLVRRSYDAFNRGDPQELIPLYDPECEWHMSNYAGWPEDRIYRGHQGLEQWFTVWLAPWEDFSGGHDRCVATPARGRDGVALEVVAGGG